MAIPMAARTHPLRPLLWVLAGFGFAEMVLLRVVGALSFDRTIAGGMATEGVVSTVGSLCLDMASVLAFVCLLVFALTPVRWRSGWSFTFVAYVVIGVVLPWASALGPWVPATYGMISAAITLVAGLVAIYRPGAHGRFAAALLLLAFMCAFTYALAPAIFGPGSTVGPGGSGTLGFGEVVYLAAGFFAFRAWGWPRVQAHRAALYGGLAVALGLAAYFGFAGPSAVAALTLSTGLTLFLPLWIYVLSTFFFATTAFACLLDTDAFATGAAFIFFLIAGLLPGNSYQQALLVLGMTLLAHGEGAFRLSMKTGVDSDMTSDVLEEGTLSPAVQP